MRSGRQTAPLLAEGRYSTQAVWHQETSHSQGGHRGELSCGASVRQAPKRSLAAYSRSMRTKPLLDRFGKHHVVL